jgi:hypothetical protein
MSKKECWNCAWLSDKYVSVCCNPDSPHCADIVSGDQGCWFWKEGTPPETPEEWRGPNAKDGQQDDGGKV